MKQSSLFVFQRSNICVSVDCSQKSSPIFVFSIQPCVCHEHTLMAGSVSLEDFPPELLAPEHEDVQDLADNAELELHMEPQRGCVWLDVVEQGQCLTHCTTLQRQMVPAPSQGGQWDLEFADDGFACLVCGDEVICLEDILQKSVFKAEHSNELFVSDNTVTPPTIVSLSSKMRNYTSRKAHIEMPSGGHLEMKCYVYSWPRGGSRMGWVTQDLYEFLGVETFGGEPSKWVWSCLDRWQGHLSKIGIDDSHFIKGMASVTAAAASTSTSAFLRFTACSTIALLALLYTWSCMTPRRGGLREGVARARASSLLSALAKGACSQVFNIQLILDDAWECMWPRPDPVGTVLQLTVRPGGDLMLAPYIAMLNSGDTSPDVRRVLFQWHLGFSHAISDGKINLSTLLSMGPGHRDGVMATLWKQLVHAAGRRLELQFHKCVVNPALVWPVRLAADDGTNDEEWGHRQVDRTCQEYRSRCRVIDWMKLPSVGCSVDKVNCRGLDLQNGYIVSAQNHGAVLVPQAT